MKRNAPSRAFALMLVLWAGVATAHVAAADDGNESCAVHAPCLTLQLADGSEVRVPSDSVDKRPQSADSSAGDSRLVDGARRMMPRPRARIFDLQSPGAIASVRG